MQSSRVDASQLSTITVLAFMVRAGGLDVADQLLFAERHRAFAGDLVLHETTLKRRAPVGTVTARAAQAREGGLVDGEIRGETTSALIRGEVVRCTVRLHGLCCWSPPVKEASSESRMPAARSRSTRATM